MCSVFTKQSVQKAEDFVGFRMPRLLTRMSQYLGSLLLGFLIFLLPVALSDPRITEAGLICGNTTQIDPSMVPNFNRLMNRLKRFLETHMEGMDFISTPSPSIVGFTQCHTDLTQSDCRTCFARARRIVEKCRPATTGRVFLDGCFLRYDQKAIIGQFADKSNDRVNCSAVHGSSHDHPMMAEFGKKVRSALQNVTRKAPHSKGFAVALAEGGNEPVYALGQCWKMVSEEGCGQCLQHARYMLMSECVPGSDGRALNAGCYLRYSTEKFYGEHAEGVTYDEVGTVITVMTVMLCFFFLLLIGVIISYLRMKRMGQGNPFTRLSSTVNKKSKINFKYEVLEKATGNFDPANKLGQGGAGSVFKGTLSDGRIVAVKRLFFSTRQWVDEFFNEVNLISETQHKNLVKLHGCSIEGPESLLVYEHVQNQSLEQHLFDRKKTRILTWDERMDIVRGIADGLAYLHGGFDSPVKIIHRDIKGSNILLDENLVPKIADFGLARCVPGADESHISTGIAGTLGYMSPEYLVRGLLTEKADVYAFGVLAIEIVTGRKNSVFMQSSSSVILSVYKHFKGNKLSETVDASLEGNFNPAEASKVLQIGLLCTQTTPELRPTMPEVVQILNGTTKEIPTPKDAPFVNASILGTDDTSSYSITETQSQDSFSTCLTDSMRDSFSRLPQAR